MVSGLDVLTVVFVAVFLSVTVESKRYDAIACIDFSFGKLDR